MLHLAERIRQVARHRLRFEGVGDALPANGARRIVRVGEAEVVRRHPQRQPRLRRASRSGELLRREVQAEREIVESGFRRLAISREHLAALADLPAPHRDPFDHLLIAQAISEKAAFVSVDREIRAYPVQLF